MNTLKEIYENYLPLNRKERYYTGTVLPQIICHENFKHLHLFLDLIENFTKDIIIKTNAFNTNIQFITEYSLKESANFIGEKYKGLPETKDTPDVVILLTEPDIILIIIEAKMFTKADVSEFKKQILAQKEVIKSIKDNLSIKNENIFHLGLVPRNYFSKDIITSCQMIYWEDVLSKYSSLLSGDYFFETLDYALKNFNALSSISEDSFGSFGKNMDDKLTGKEIVDFVKLGKKFWVGRKGGLNGKVLSLDVESGGWKTFPYEVNYSSKEPPNANWFYAREFAELITKTSYKSEETLNDGPSDPWHFSYLGKDFFENVSKILGFKGVLDCPIQSIFTGNTSDVTYKEKIFGRKVNPNWWVLLLDGRQLKYGTTTGNKIVQGNFSAAGYKRTSWDEIKKYNW